MTRKFFARLRVIVRHYSTWALGLLGAVGGLYEFVPAFRDDLPPWLIVTLAVAGLVGKYISQEPKPGELSAQTYADYQRNLPR